MGVIIIIAIIAVWFFYSQNMAKKKDPNANFGSIIWEMMVVLFKLSVKFFKYITDKDNQERYLKEQIRKCKQKIQELKSRPSNSNIEVQISEFEIEIAEMEMKLEELQAK